MILVADASVLVAELLRQRDRSKSRSVYAHQETTARRRVPQDPNDWPPVALALTLATGILTGDQDFLGCGCPTWTVDTLRAELDQP